MPKILGKDYSDRIAQMQTDLEKSSRKPVSYELLKGTPQELLCRGEYQWKHGGGSIVRLVTEATEYDCAHELAHGLMTTDGYPIAGVVVTDSNRAVKEAVSILSNTIAHEIMHSTYLPRYGFEQEGKEHYFDAVRQLLSSPRALKDSDNPDNYFCLFNATGFVEIYFFAKDEYEKLRKAVKNVAPNTWRLSRILIRARKYRPGNSPFHVRTVLVEMVGVLNRFLKDGFGIDMNMLKRTLVEPVLRPRQANLRASKVFKIEIYKSERCYRLACVRMIGDGSYCYIWECQHENHLNWVREKFENSRAGEFLALIDESGFKVRLLHSPE